MTTDRRDDTDERAGAPKRGPTDGEGRFERRAWVVIYVVIMCVLAAGAARRIAAMF